MATAGIFSAWQQQALNVRSRKLAWVITVLAIPLGSLSLDAMLHLRLDHGNMRALGIGALFATLLSATFHWHVMRNGAMLVGRGTGSFWDDMKRMPRLVVTFVWDPICWVRNRIRTETLPEPAEDMEIAA